MANDQFDDEDALDEATKQGALSDMVKKLFASGVSAAFLTEEIVRNQLKDLKVPKEIIQLVVNGANKSKEEIIGRVSKEVGEMIKKVDFAKELHHFMETHEINIKISATKKDQ